MHVRLVGCLIFVLRFTSASDSPEGPKSRSAGPPDDPVFFRTEILLPGQTTRTPAGGEENEGDNDDGESEVESEGGSAPQPPVRSSGVQPGLVDVVVDTRPTAAAQPPVVDAPAQEPAVATIAIPTVVIGDPTEGLTGQLQLRDTPAIGVRPYQNRYRTANSYHDSVRQAYPALSYSASSVVPSLRIPAAVPSVYPVQQNPGNFPTKSSGYIHKEQKQAGLAYHKDAPVKAAHQSSSPRNSLFGLTDRLYVSDPAALKHGKPYGYGYRIADFNSPKLGVVVPTPPPSAVSYSPVASVPPQDVGQHQQPPYPTSSHGHNGYPSHPAFHNSPRVPGPYGYSHAVGQAVYDPPVQHPQTSLSVGHYIPALNHNPHHQSRHGYSPYQSINSPPIDHHPSPYPNGGPPLHAVSPVPPTDAPVPAEAPEPTEPTPAVASTTPTSVTQNPGIGLLPATNYHPGSPPQIALRNFNTVHFSPEFYQSPYKPAPHHHHPEQRHGAPPPSVPTPFALHSHPNHPAPVGVYQGYPPPFQQHRNGHLPHEPVRHIYSEVATYKPNIATGLAHSVNDVHGGTGYSPAHSLRRGGAEPVHEPHVHGEPVAIDHTSPRCAQEAQVPYCLSDYDYPLVDITAYKVQHPDKFKLLRPMVLWQSVPVSGPSAGYNSLDQYPATPVSSGPCAAHTYNSAKLYRAMNDHGRWKVVVQLPESVQITFLEICARNRTCGHLEHHWYRQCVQDYVLQPLMVYSSEFGIHIDQMRIPRGCQCQMAGSIPGSNTRTSPTAAAPYTGYATPTGL